MNYHPPLFNYCYVLSDDNIMMTAMMMILSSSPHDDIYYNNDIRYDIRNYTDDDDMEPI